MVYLFMSVTKTLPPTPPPTPGLPWHREVHVIKKKCLSVNGTDP